MRNYDLWDGWIIAALVLVGHRRDPRATYGQGVHARHDEGAGAPGGRPDRGSNAELLAINRTQTGVLLHALVSLVFLLIVLDMIWKPGA